MSDANKYENSRGLGIQLCAMQLFAEWNSRIWICAMQFLDSKVQNIESSLRSVLPMKIRMASYLSLACFAVLLLGLDDGIGHRGRSKLLDHLGTNQPLACSEGTIPLLFFELKVKGRLLPAAFTHFPLLLKDLQHCGIAKSSCTSSTNFDWGFFASESGIGIKDKFSNFQSWIHNAMHSNGFFFLETSDI